MSVLKITFTNNSNVDNSLVSIGFQPGSGTGSVTTQITNAKAGGGAINTISGTGSTFPFAGNWYSLSDLSEGVNVTNFSGRIYVCYGSAWAVQYNDYEPAQAVTDPNFFLRYDKMELTFTGDPADVADLTSIDYWSIPMSLNTYMGTTKVQSVSGFTNGATTQSVYNALLALTNPPVSGLAGPGGTDGTALKALVPGDFVQYPKGPAPLTSFGRIIGPSSYPPSYPLPGAVPVTPYDTIKSYLDFLNTTFGVGTATTTVPNLGNGTIAKIAGNFAGVGPGVPATGPQSAQTYDLTATIDSSNNITLTGTVSGVSGGTTMVFNADDIMNSTGFYGGNAPFSLNGAAATPPANDVYGWVTGDLFSGMNIGALGSSYEVSGIPGAPSATKVGSLNSQYWFRIPQSDFFATLQPTGKYYNQYAQVLSGVSDAYNFAYTDRFAHVLLSLNPANVDILEIVMDDATVTM